MRRRYLVCYDITDDRRLRQVAKTMKGWGYRVQYSIFLCDLSGMELVAMRSSLRRLIHHGRDSVMIVDLGEVARWNPDRVEVLGIDKDEAPDEPLVF